MTNCGGEGLSTALRAWRGFVLVAAFAALSTTAEAGPTTDLSPALQQDTACMLKVLKTEPDVSSAEMSLSFKDGRKQVTVSYEHSGVDGRTSVIAFSSWTESVGGYYEPLFAAAISGVHAVGTALDDMGTVRVVADWKRQCGVESIVMSL